MFYGLGPDDVDQYAARVGAVDGSVVKATTQASFPASGDLAIVLIGDAARIGDAVKKYGPVTKMSITDPTYYPPSAK